MAKNYPVHFSNFLGFLNLLLYFVAFLCNAPWRRICPSSTILSKFYRWMTLCTVLKRCRVRLSTTSATTAQLTSRHWRNDVAAVSEQCANVCHCLTRLPAPLCACSSSPGFDFRFGRRRRAEVEDASDCRRIAVTTSFWRSYVTCRVSWTSGTRPATSRVSWTWRVWLGRCSLTSARWRAPSTYNASPNITRY